MKFGIVGGIGPASTIEYYNGIVAKYLSETGNYPSIVIDSIDMSQMIEYFSRSDYKNICFMITNSLKNLKNAGAECAVISSNTPHIIFDMIKENSPLPVISIVDVTCMYIKNMKFKNALILGTAFTMKSKMYEKALSYHGISSVTPSAYDIQKLHEIIYPNLENGIVVDNDKLKMIEISEHYISTYNTDTVILGCTEIPLMIKENDLSVPVIDTTQIHINAVIDKMCNCPDIRI